MRRYHDINCERETVKDENREIEIEKLKLRNLVENRDLMKFTCQINIRRIREILLFILLLLNTFDTR